MRFRFALSVLFLLVCGCGVNNTKKTYVLAEKLWTDGRYAASVAEFDKVTARDPRGKLGLQALYRSATTQAYFLSQYSEAIRKFRSFVEASSDPELNWEAQKQIGEIYYTKLEQYDQTILHYRKLLQLKPTAAEAPEFLFRIGKSHFHLWQFDEAVQVLEDLAQKTPSSLWAERALYEVGNSYLAEGGMQASSRPLDGEALHKAIRAYERFLKLFPKSEWVPHAKFGIASCFEEMDQLDSAYQAYEVLKTTYPSPRVIQIKLNRIRERQHQRSR